MMTLFLTASFSDVAEHLPKFLGEAMKDKRVCFIPTACDVEEITFFMENDRQAFIKLGALVDELNLSTMPNDVLLKKIADSDLIFVGGGNTFYLLQKLKQTGLDQAIIRAVHQGKPYIGTLAGSMIACPDIAYISAMDDKSKAPDLRNTQALALTPCYIVPHFNNPPFQAIAHQIYEEFRDTLPLVTLDNHQFLGIRGNQQQLFG